MKGFFFLLFSSLFVFSVLPFAFALQTSGGDSGRIGITHSGSMIIVGNDNLCGNVHIDQGEQCDGSNLNGKSCQSLGYDAGVLSCKNDCTWDATSGCYNNPVNPPAGGDGGGSGGSGGGSSGGGSSSCIEDWVCTSWSSCSGGEQSRICEDGNKCGSVLIKPAEERACDSGSDATVLVNSSSSSGFFSSITGAVIGGGAGSWIAVLILIVVVLLVLWYVFYRNNSSGNGKKK